MTQDSKAKNDEKRKNNALNDFFMRLGTLGEVLAFFWRRKLYWMIPMLITLFLFAIIIIIGSSGPGGVFVYTLF